MVCNECKECFNYLVSELGCFGNSKPCEFLETDNEDYNKDTKISNNTFKK